MLPFPFMEMAVYKNRDVGGGTARAPKEQRDEQCGNLPEGLPLDVARSGMTRHTSSSHV